MSLSLVAEDLCKSYKGRLVVDSVSLRVNPGEIVGLLGPNGAGKTTTFKMILGLEQQDRGTVSYGKLLDGTPLHIRARSGLGYLSQTPSIFSGLNVLDNLLVILETLRHPSPKQRSCELLRRFGLENLAKQKARTLSGGERRRLEFARALCSEPGVLLVDEPFAGVDPIAVSDISTTIRELARDRIGIMLTDHAVREALNVCDRIYLIVNGRIVESGTSDHIRNSEVAKRLYLGSGFNRL